MTLLPPDAQGVILADVRTIRGAWFVARLDEVVGPLLDDRAREIRALLDRVDEVAIAYHYERTEGGDRALVVVARGSFNEHDLDTLGRDHTPGTHRVHLLRNDDGMSLALTGSHTLTFGNAPLVLAVLDRMDGLVPATGPTRSVVLDAARRIELGQHTITYAAEVSDVFRAELGGELSPRGTAVSVGARLDVGSTLTAHGFGLFAGPDAAREVAAEIRDKLAEFAQEAQTTSIGLSEMGMLAIINALHVQADGSAVTADLTLDHEAVERVVNLVLMGFQARMESFEPAAGEPTGDDVPPEPASDEAPTP